MGREEEIAELEEEIRKTPYHKGTQAHIGKLKARIAKLREATAKKGGSGGYGYGIRKSGDATVIMVGFPSVGKSTLLNALTNAESKTAEYDFTTLDVIPGVLEYNGAKIQLLDLPGVIEGASDNKGRGKEVFSVARMADLIIIVADDQRQIAKVRKELNDAGFRLDEKRPDVKLEKKERGGISVSASLQRGEVVSILHEFGVHNADIVMRSGAAQDQLIDFLVGSRVYVPSIAVMNKADKGKPPGMRDALLISAKTGKNLEHLRQRIWEKLGLMRIYMKRPGKEPDMGNPLIEKAPRTVADVAEKILKVHVKYFKYARIWGPSARFPGQKVGGEHLLMDKDVIELNA